MSNPANNDNSEILAKLAAVRVRLMKRFTRPQFIPPDIAAPSMKPLREAQLAASNMAEAIGTLNPRRPGLINSFLQVGKKALARALEWQVRPQREFNKAVLEALSKTSELLEATNENILVLNAALQRFPPIHKATGKEIDSLREEISTQVFRLEDAGRNQHRAFEGALARQSELLQARTYELMDQALEEVRVLRQRIAARQGADAARLTEQIPPTAPAAATTLPGGIDYYQIERHFRGTEDEIRARQSFYIPFFKECKNVLDIACGRGEFLDIMRAGGVAARGVDLNGDMVGRCLQKGLDVTQADVFSYLDTVPEASLGGIFCAQFIEHLTPESYVALISRCADKLVPGGLLAIETQNPECLAIFSRSFFLDPTHVKPIPPGLLRVLFAEAGFEKVSAHFLSPASVVLPLIPPLPAGSVADDALQQWNSALQRFNEAFFGGMDYALLGYRSRGRSA
jgi:2-polyprenyl-3-methyl-5-hydroxy-6-metoxy-1,4-benzoquinol methylase